MRMTFLIFLRLQLYKIQNCLWFWLQEYAAELWIIFNLVLLGFMLLLASSIFLTVVLPEYAIDIDLIHQSKLLPAVPVTVGIINFITTVILFRKIFYARPNFMLKWVVYYAVQAVFILLIGLGMGLCIVIYLPQHIHKLGGAISVSMLIYFGIVKACLGILCYLYLKWDKEYRLSLIQKGSNKKLLTTEKPALVGKNILST